MTVVTYRTPPDRIDLDDPNALATGLIEKAINGVEKRRSQFPHPEAYNGKLEIVGRDRHIDTQTVCQIAIWHLLSGIEFQTVHLEALLEEDIRESRTFSIERCFFSHPSPDQKSEPRTAATILPIGEAVYNSTNFGAEFIEDTLDAYGEGTVLQQTSEMTMGMEVHIMVPYSEERRAIRSAFELEFLAEPNDDVQGRKVVVPEYYDRTVTTYFRGMGDLDDEATAKSDTREVVMRFDVQVDVVRLVKIPGFIEDIGIDTLVGTDIDVENC